MRGTGLRPEEKNCAQGAAKRARSRLWGRYCGRLTNRNIGPLPGARTRRRVKMKFQTALADNPSLAYIDGKFDIVGDVHGEVQSLTSLMKNSGWVIEPYDVESCAPIRAHHPQGRHLVFTGDLINKGPDSLMALRVLVGMTDQGTASAVAGNHEDMLLDAVYHPDAAPKKSVEQTLRDLSKCPASFVEQVLSTLSKLPAQLHLPMPPGLKHSGSGRLIVLHAGARPEDIGSTSSSSRRRTVHGIGLNFGVKKNWAMSFKGHEDWIIHGHTPSRSAKFIGKVVGLDTGAASGGCLTMLRADSGDIISVKAA
eukprot:GHVR01104238.1.p1 GENE.GHVR01104238.1~~GHVR01104238.1.p1  ORF type:complete len:310 (+),score=22.38 GHVR01104238.1:187-1116(+)